MTMYIHLFVLSLFFYLQVPAFSDPLAKFCTSSANFSDNSTYQSNINLLSSSLIANSTSTGFASGSVGSVPNRVYGLVLCRGDVNSSSCSPCLSNGFQEVQQLCPYDRTAWIFYKYCLLKFSNEEFISSTDNSPAYIRWNLGNVSNPARSTQIVTDLISNASSWASYNSTRRFALAEATNFSQEFPVIYALAQCTQDFTPSQCQSCLQGLIGMIPQYFEGRKGGRILSIRCNFRYEVNSFFNGDPMVHLDATSLALAPPPNLAPASPPNLASAPPPVPESTGSTRKEKNTTTIAIAVAVPAVAVCFSVIAFGFCYWKKRRISRKVLRSLNEFNSDGMEGANSLLLTLSTLRDATTNFDETNKIGEGGFGTVYRGTLPDGRDIAVKRLSQSSRQGLRELKNELVLIAKLQHKNLVRLLGVCLEEEEKLLVYEFVPNKSLDTFLFNPERRGELNWRIRLRIIDGIARGLQYLHEESQLRIIHRDLKASNVLLDSNMSPKIADFGLARLFTVDQTVEMTNRVAGTLGYMAPEYAMHGLYSIKSDVFSFGVLLLEIITGKRNSGMLESDEPEHLLSTAWDHWTSGTIYQMVDTKLEDCPAQEVVRCVNIALLCVQDSPTDRPKMSEVLIMLSSNTGSLQAPSRPPFYNLGGVSGHSSNDSGQKSQNLVSITELEAR